MGDKNEREIIENRITRNKNIDILFSCASYFSFPLKGGGSTQQRGRVRTDQSKCQYTYFFFSIYIIT